MTIEVARSNGSDRWLTLCEMFTAGDMVEVDLELRYRGRKAQIVTFAAIYLGFEGELDPIPNVIKRISPAMHFFQDNGTISTISCRYIKDGRILSSLDRADG